MNINDFIENLARRTDDAVVGLEDSFKLFRELKQIESVVKDCLESLKDDAISVIDNYSKNECQFDGKVFNVQSRTNWSFKGIEEVEIAEKKLKLLKEKYKLGVEEIDQETGEVIEVKGKKTTSTFIKSDKIKTE